MSDSSSFRLPRFCGRCGYELPPETNRFCSECGAPVRQPPPELADQEPQLVVPAATGPTVKLANAPGQQSVVGGTVKLPSSGAVPPGMWFAPDPPGPEAIIALYAPLRAIVGGWSATLSDGWSKIGQAWANDGTARDLVRFAIEREWFAARGAAGDLRLRVQIGAISEADEGRTRRGFRYRIGADAPMEVLRAWWLSAAGKPQPEVAVPQIQLMAPPRVARVSDYHEAIQRLDAREADQMVRRGAVHGLFKLPNSTQQRTPVGRGIPLLEIPKLAQIEPVARMLYPQLYRVQITRPLLCEPRGWQALRRKIKHDAHGLGLDIETDAMLEWWIDREGYDGALLERGTHRFGNQRVAVAFRRAQIVEIVYNNP